MLKYNLTFSLSSTAAPRPPAFPHCSPSASSQFPSLTAKPVSSTTRIPPKSLDRSHCSQTGLEPLSLASGPQVHYFLVFFGRSSACGLPWPGISPKPHCSNSRSLTYCAGLGIESVSQSSQDATDPAEPQQELHSFFLLFFFFFHMFLKVIFFFFSFLRPHPWHMEVPRLVVKLELQLLV